MLAPVTQIRSFLSLNTIPLWGYTVFRLSILLPINSVCGLLAVVNNAAMNVSVQVSSRVPPFNSFGYRLQSGISE